MSAKDKGIRTSHEIMEAAIKCVATIGMENTSLTEIGKIAGVNRSLVAYHFPKKDELFFQITDYIINDLTKFLETNLEKPTNIDEISSLMIKYFSLNHNYLLTFVNFLYYCGLKYRYYGQLKELLFYFKSLAPIADQPFDEKIDLLIGKLIRMSIEAKHK
jgi:AcrR family transcriptional regulator